MKKGMYTIKLLVMVMALLGITFSPAAYNPSMVTADAATVKISKKKMTMNVGESKKINIKGTKTKVIWSSSNSKVATVNRKGVVIAKAAGRAKIRAKVKIKKNWKTFYCNVTVKEGENTTSTDEESSTGGEDTTTPASQIILNNTEASVLIGKTITLTANIEPSNATITWSSSNESVATVSNGLVSGCSEGTAVITASSGEVKATCEVTVKDAKKLLIDYIKSNGETNSDGNCLIGKDESNGGRTAIIYEENNKTVNMTYATNENSYSTMGMLTIKNNDDFTNQATVTYNYFSKSGGSFEAQATLDIESYTLNDTLQFNVISGTDSEQLQNLCNKNLKLSVAKFNLLLNEKCDIWMKDLGYKGLP